MLRIQSGIAKTASSLPPGMRVCVGFSLIGFAALALMVASGKPPWAEARGASLQLGLVGSITNVGVVKDSTSSELQPGLGKLSLVSCAACHGSQSFLDPQDRNDHWRSAYQIWASRDPHANAYVSLWNRQSQQIVAALARHDGDLPSAVRLPLVDKRLHQTMINERCVSCHSTVPVSLTAESLGGPKGKTAGLLPSGGVSCHSCHSARELDEPAGHAWVVAHTRESWPTMDTRQKTDAGLRDLSQHKVRAQTCLKCHVGSPGREVNHDLIAAGHPRLVFEYSSHLSRLPKHWHEDIVPGYHTSCWSMGQIETAMASLALLQHRAEASISVIANHNQTASHSPASWPEFSEYNCHNCHHDLQTNWYLDNEKPHQGQPLWGTWAFPAQFGSAFSGVAINAIRDKMESPNPDAEQIRRVTSETQKFLLAKSAGEHLYQYLQSQPRLNSDELFAWYLAANSCVRDFKPNQQPEQELATAALIELKNELDRPFRSTANNQETLPLTAAVLSDKVSRIRDLVLPVLRSNIPSAKPLQQSSNITP